VPLAEQVAKQYGTHHHTAWVTKQDFLKHCDAICKAMDQPSIDGINSYFVSKVASESGLKVVISGLGGDELLGGYPSFQQIPRLVTAALPFHAVPFLGKAFRYVSVPILKHCTSPKYSGLLEYGSTYGGAYLLRRGMFMPWELPDLLDRDMVREGWNELRTLSRLKETTIGIRNSRLKVCALESTWYMRNQLLRDADWASMAHSLEVRVPLVDINLYRALTSLLSSSSQIGKRDMGLTVRPSLPHEIIERDKTGFSIPVRDWVMHSTNTTSRERGLRRWAQLLYAHETGDKYSTYVTCQ
jgi:asparagine synthase (glutamine-hydrolysing)